MLKISTAPHLSTSRTTPVLMRDVVIALLPALVAAIFFFGLNALCVVVTAVAGCVMFEYLATRYLFKTANTTGDYSAVITGLLLAYNLPSSMPILMVLVGCFMAIIVAKLCYGGLGKNLFNPALVGRVFLFISFPVQMTHWPKPHFMQIFTPDAQTGATTLGILKHLDAQTSATSLSAGQYSAHDLPSYWQMFSGDIGGCLGEVSALALLLGLAWLLYRRVITWKIPFYYVATVFLITAVMYLYSGDIRYDPISHLLSGGLMLGAIFMATDYTTSPMTANGQILFAVGCGVLTVIIRLYSAYPEGVSFAILIMNAFVPLIDKYSVPRIYGRGGK